MDTQVLARDSKVTDMDKRVILAVNCFDLMVSDTLKISSAANVSLCGKPQIHT
jgi:hypothetical protein